MVEAMRDMARAVRDEVLPSPPPVPPGREAAVDPLLAKKWVLMREFEKRNPPSFSGDQGPLAAEDWLQWINRIFDFILLEDNATRINAASFMFTNEALQWWNCTLGTHPLVEMT